METGQGVLLGVWEAGAEWLSGQTMLFNIDWDERAAELGFWIAPWARGRGSALRLTLAFAFDHLGIERLSGLTGVDNVPAQRAMKGAVLQREGVLRGLEKTPTGRLDQVCCGSNRNPTLLSTRASYGASRTASHPPSGKRPKCVRSCRRSLPRSHSSTTSGRSR